MTDLHKVLLLTALVLCSLGAVVHAEYTATGRCSEFRKVCTYNYTSEQTHFDGEEKQTFDFSATVDLSCRSTGTFSGQSATKYCIKVRDAEINSALLSDPRRETVENGAEEVIEELQGLINTTVEDAGNGQSRVIPGQPSVTQQLFDKGFCFIRTADGKIADVIYLADENVQVVNIKKSIVSAFQANFGNKLSREESDVTGLHRAAYSFRRTASPSTFSFERLVTSKDVVNLAGVPSGRTLKGYSRKEDISYDNNILTRATGRTSVVLSSLTASDSRARRSMTASRQSGLDPDVASFDDGVTLEDELKGDGTYSLTRVRCTTSILDRLRRSVAGDFEDGSEVVSDSIEARIDQVLIDKGRMSRLRRSLSSIPAALKDLHKDPEQYKIANAIHELISLEGEHGPLPGHTPAVNDVLSYLEKVLDGKSENDGKTRNLIYSMLAPEGGDDVQKKLVDILERLDLDDEKNTLQTYLAFLKNANMMTVGRLDNLVKDNNDPLLLVLGSMAEFTTEKVADEIVTRLANRLGAAEQGNVDAIVHLLHALGNTGAPSSVKTLMFYLQHDNIDVQIAAIGALRMHANEPMVQAAFTKLLENSHEEEIVESITQTLLTSIKDHFLHPEDKGDSSDLVAAIVRAALLSDNGKLHALVMTFLEEVGTDQAHELIAFMMENADSNPDLDKFEYDVDNEIFNDTEASRQRRGSDWDASYSDYDVVASYSSRRSDVSTYPQHKAYIWGKKFGISDVYARFGAGGFIGSAENGQKYKIFTKAIAEGHAFGETATAVHAEYLRTRSYRTVYQKIYVKIIGKVLMNEDGPAPLACLERTYKLYQTQRLQLFSFKFSVFIYVGSLDFYVSLYATLKVDVHFCACEHYYTACATLIPQISLIPTAGASATLVEIVRGGIEVTGNFVYQLEPELCIKIDFEPSVSITPCITVYHSWPNSYVEIYAYYQLRQLKLKAEFWKSSFYWGSKNKWSDLSKRWDLPYSGRNVLWSSCGGSIVCDPDEEVTIGTDNPSEGEGTIPTVPTIPTLPIG